MTGPDIKQLKENFDKFSKSLEESEVDENVEEEIVEQAGADVGYLASPKGRELQQRQKAAAQRAQEAKFALQANDYWLMGKVPVRKNMPDKSLINTFHKQAGARPKKELSGITGLSAYMDGTGSRPSVAVELHEPAPKMAYGGSPGVEFAGNRPVQGSKTAGSSIAYDRGRRERLRAHIQEAVEGMKGGKGMPSNQLAMQYFNGDRQKMINDIAGREDDAWRVIKSNAQKYFKWLDQLIKKASSKYNKEMAARSKNKQDFAKASEEYTATTRAFKAGALRFGQLLKMGLSSEEALAGGDEAAEKVIGPHDKASKPAPKPGPAPAPGPKPAPVADKGYKKLKVTDKEVTDIFEDNTFILNEDAPQGDFDSILDRLIQARNDAFEAIQMGAPVDIAQQEIRKQYVALNNLQAKHCNDLTGPVCSDIEKLMPQIKSDLKKLKAYKKEQANKPTPKPTPKPEKKKGGRGGKSQRKERCGKAPQGEYGSRGFKPRPNNLKSKARQEKYPEIKKIFDQFYADLDEFGVKINKDFWWGTDHSKAYRRILCKLDEKSAKPKEKESGPVDYKLANKYNANRQRLGVPILTGDQLKADYLSKLIRGGMHMGLSHEESDKLIGGRRKKAAEPVKQQAKSKSLSGKEALEAYESAVKIYNAAKGFTDSDEENMIMMVVEKHISEGTIGALYNMYSRVLRQQGATDRGDLVRELFNEDLPALARKVRAALMRKTRGAQFREGKVYPSKNKVVYAGKSMNLNKLIEHISNGEIKDYKSLKFEIRKKAILESKNNRAVQSSKIADVWILNWLKENIGG